MPPLRLWPIAALSILVVQIGPGGSSRPLSASTPDASGGASPAQSVPNSPGEQDRTSVSLHSQLVLGSEWRLPNSAVEPWSPDGRYLVLHKPDGVHVLDTSKPDAQPFQILDKPAPYHSWSPDGKWLACRTGSAWGSDQFSLIAAPVEAGKAVAMISKTDVGPFLWASDGNIYYWDRRNRRRHSMPPPEAWVRSARTLSTPARDQLITFPPSTIEGPTLHRFSQTQSIEHVPAALHQSGIDRVLPRSTFPSNDRFLVGIHEHGRPTYTAIVDSDGHVIRNLGSYVGPNAFIGSSVSFDGTYIIGFSEVDSLESIIAAPLILASVDGTWRIQLEGFSGIWPRFSPTDNRIAFTEPLTREVHVCTIRITSTE